jgi:hypothetical protein
MAEEEEVDKPGRLQVREVAARELEVSTRERRGLLRELERAAVGGALEPAREPRTGGKGHELETEEQ